jgi:hypothetical protein
MTVLRETQPFSRQERNFSLGNLLAAATLAGLGALALLVFIGMKHVMLPLAAILLITGFSVALVAWVTGARRSATEITSWDVAGSLIFVGFASALLST